MTQNTPPIDLPTVRDAQVLDSLASDYRRVMMEVMLP